MLRYRDDKWSYRHQPELEQSGIAAHSYAGFELDGQGMLYLQPEYSRGYGVQGGYPDTKEDSSREHPCVGVQHGCTACKRGRAVHFRCENAGPSGAVKLDRLDGPGTFVSREASGIEVKRIRRLFQSAFLRKKWGRRPSEVLKLRCDGSHRWLLTPNRKCDMTE